MPLFKYPFNEKQIANKIQIILSFRWYLDDSNNYDFKRV